MVLIYSASGDRKSSQRSSRLIEPLLRWLFPDLTEDTVWLVVVLVRKCAHLTEFAILALLVWRALRVRGERAWSWRLARNAWLLAVLYAASDELHQWFVPDRQASGWDVVIDATGAAAGLIGLWALGRWRRWWADRDSAPGPLSQKGDSSIQ
jgi:VanZ family protein